MQKVGNKRDRTTDSVEWKRYRDECRSNEKRTFCNETQKKQNGGNKMADPSTEWMARDLFVSVGFFFGLRCGTKIS